MIVIDEIFIGDYVLIGGEYVVFVVIDLVLWFVKGVIEEKLV